jgi:hypothetical protein
MCYSVPTSGKDLTMPGVFHRGDNLFKGLVSIAAIFCHTTPLTMSVSGVGVAVTSR